MESMRMLERMKKWQQARIHFLQSSRHKRRDAEEWQAGSEVRGACTTELRTAAKRSPDEAGRSPGVHHHLSEQSALPKPL